MATRITDLGDVQAAFRRPIPDADHAWVEDQIDDAELVLATYRGNLARWIDGGETDADVADRTAAVKRVVVRMVARVLRNPDGFASETDGDYSYSRLAAAASGEVHATPADLRLLGLAKRRAGTIRATLPADSPRNVARSVTPVTHLGGFE